MIRVNVGAMITPGTGNVDTAMARAHRVVSSAAKAAGDTAPPMEPCTVAARWGPMTGTLHVWSSTQMPYGMQQRIAKALYRVRAYRCRGRILER